MRLHDGRLVFIRPILPGDTAELAKAISTADPDMIHRPLLGGRPHVTPDLMAHLLEVDYVRRVALVAIDPERRQGVAPLQGFRLARAGRDRPVLRPGADAPSKAREWTLRRIGRAGRQDE